MYVLLMVAIIGYILGFVTYFTLRIAYKEWQQVNQELEHKKRALERQLDRLNG